jgi:hypothetical protein
MRAIPKAPQRDSAANKFLAELRLGVVRPRMPLSFLSDCDDVALPALKLDPDAEMAHVVLADVKVR